MVRIVLVTGASTGIGRAAVLRLAAAGCTVFAGVRKEADGSRLREQASNITPVLLDVTDQEQIQVAATYLREAVGRLDGLVNNAGVGVTGPVEFVSLESLRWQYEVNVFGQVAVTQAMLPLLRRAQGRVVTVGSVGSWITMPFGGPLCSSKHAIRSLNDALRMELAPLGIRTALVEPGSIRTAGVDKVETGAAATLDGMGPEGRDLYGPRFQAMTAAAMKRERGGSDPDVAARAIQHALTARNPRTRYPVGKDSRAMSTLARILPQHVLDTLRTRALGIATGAPVDKNKQEKRR